MGRVEEGASGFRMIRIQEEKRRTTEPGVVAHGEGQHALEAGPSIWP